MKVVCPTCESKDWITKRLDPKERIHTIRCPACGWNGDHKNLLILGLPDSYWKHIKPKTRWWNIWDWMKNMKRI